MGYPSMMESKCPWRVCDLWTGFDSALHHLVIRILGSQRDAEPRTQDSLDSVLKIHAQFLISSKFPHFGHITESCPSCLALDFVGIASFWCSRRFRSWLLESECPQ